MSSVNKYTFTPARVTASLLAFATCIYFIAMLGSFGNSIFASNDTAGDPKKTLIVEAATPE